MGKISKVLYEAIVPDLADRKGNLLKVTRSNGNEVHIQFRNFRISLHDEEEIQEWKRGFIQAKENLKEHFINDI